VILLSHNHIFAITARKTITAVIVTSSLQCDLCNEINKCVCYAFTVCDDRSLRLDWEVKKSTTKWEKSNF